jgi:hypothetical protein
LFAGDTPLTNGRREDYEAAIDRLFGSLALFLRSAFVSQRPTGTTPTLPSDEGREEGDLPRARGARHLQAAAETAKNTAGGIESETELMEAQLGGKREALNAVPASRSG